MSFLSDTVLSGASTRLHIAGTPNQGNKPIRKSKSHGGFLSPLTKLVRNPAQSIGDVIGSNYDAPFQDTVDENAGRKQILYLRMKNVGALPRHYGYHMLTARHRPKHTTSGKLQRSTSTS
jgi:TAG lipase/steryl ester hydrolase/phospholipase A2/LPA acyltransferase